MADQHRLRTEWRFSYQPYGPWKVVDIVIISTVEHFWVGLAHMPTPSLAFRVTDNYTRPTFKHDVGTVRSLCLRRNNIERLEWEDPNNSGMYRCDLKNIDSVNLDKIWEVGCMSAIGEIFGDNARAVRIIDRGKKKTVNVRVEVWCKDKCSVVEKGLKEKFDDVFEWVDFESLLN